MTDFHIAQLNIARMLVPLGDPAMASFVARLDEINALADRSAGFVWRLQTPEGNATHLRPEVSLALWWAPVGHLPGVDEAKQRLEYLEAHGPTPFAFSFRTRFPADSWREGEAR